MWHQMNMTGYKISFGLIDIDFNDHVAFKQVGATRSTGLTIVLLKASYVSMRVVIILTLEQFRHGNYKI